MSSEITARFTDELARHVLDIAARDSKFPGEQIKSNTTDDELLKLAARMVNACYSGEWREHLTLSTRDQIIAEVQNAFRREPEPHDPLAESAARNVGSFDPWERANAIHAPEQVAVLGPRVKNEIDPDTGTGRLSLGGAA